MIALTRIDSARNMRRFWRVHTTPTLFGEWQVWREWGRLGRSGTLKIATYAGGGESPTAQRASEAPAWLQGG